MSERENLTEKKQKAKFLGFTRDNVAVGTAGFVAGVDMALPIPGRVIHPFVEGKIVFLDVFALLEKYLPGSQQNIKK